MSEPNETAQRPDYETGGVQHGFQLPGWIWAAMFGCYAVFFLFILLATGRDRHALFAIVISVLYTLMYFSTAALLSSIKGKERSSPLSRGQYLQTLTGPMSLTAVTGQVLAIPVALAIFAIGVALVVWGLG